MNEDMNKMFKVETEDGVTRDAKLLFVFELQENGKDYAVYSIPGPDEMDNVFGGILTKSNDGEAILNDLETEEEKTMIKTVIDGLITGEIAPSV